MRFFAKAKLLLWIYQSINLKAALLSVYVFVADVSGKGPERQKSERQKSKRTLKIWKGSEHWKSFFLSDQNVKSQKFVKG
jgi:hypothetical protein